MIRKLSCLAIALSLAGCSGGLGGGDYGLEQPLFAGARVEASRSAMIRWW